MGTPLPPIPAKRYFTIGEVAALCGVKPHVLRYWEQEFTQLRPMKRRGNRRYYQHHEVLMIRRIRDLLYEQGFTISGARNRLQEAELSSSEADPATSLLDGVVDSGKLFAPHSLHAIKTLDAQVLRQELFEIRALLSLK
ncbi:MerR family transcriptional regulator [Acidovorax sp. SUPP3334]|uniref:MerR family transcriptional regulator n=1 Tax=Acidovorax sp. SUPP3334 TaxID=2920881 RepID=UPI0023DE4B6A|nr:MerR family transcriptional regulator [Acidovorax sp. SUPP3334]GKT23760.1 MerR family transcriptional regulator [Acidovorax sp. SUPP3334]